MNESAEPLRASPRDFLQLHDFLLPAPLPAIVAVCLVLGIWYLGHRCARRLRGEANTTLLDVAAGFVLMAALLAGLVHLLAWCGAASLTWLRLLGIPIACCAPLQIRRWGIWIRNQGLPRARLLWRETSFTQRFGLICSGLIIVGLWASALGPPTDIDSLDYHLGVPLDWLRHGGAYPRADWLEARLAGSGESLNLLGLALGTDILGAVLQTTGLILAIIAVASGARTRSDRIFAILMVTSCPTMVALASSQKPQLLPVAATTVAMVLIIQRFRAIDPASLLLAFGCASFAMGCKYSFLFTGFLILGMGLAAARRVKYSRKALAMAGITVSLIAGPVYLRNLSFYGDPLSPFLERWTQEADPVVTAFAYRIRNFHGNHSLKSLMKFILKSIFPTGLGRVTTVLGIGSLGFLLAIGDRQANRFLLGSAAIFVLSSAVFAPLSTRFLLEPYLWCTFAVVATRWRTSKRIFFMLLSAQASLVAGISLFGAATLFPGAWTQEFRHQVMRNAADQYEVSQWMDEILPSDAVILSDIWANALLPRPFVASDLAYYLSRSGLPADAQADRLLEVAKQRGVTSLIRTLPKGRSPDSYCWQEEVKGTPYARLAPYFGEPLGKSASFRETARNPWNRGEAYEMMAIELNLDGVP